MNGLVKFSVAVGIGIDSVRLTRSSCNWCNACILSQFVPVLKPVDLNNLSAVLQIWPPVM